jgi:hypothetical protein
LLGGCVPYKHRQRLPFGVPRFKYFDGALDGSLEVGLEPTFERFDTVGQNFAGVGLELRYYLLHFRYGRWVPWIDASIAPGGTDLRIGRVSNETRLTGPFMNLIQGGIGVSYFVTERGAIYTGLHASISRTRDSTVQIVTSVSTASRVSSWAYRGSFDDVRRLNHRKAGKQNASFQAATADFVLERNKRDL